ncbi:family 78 glycoside hydrolase catalytic domain [Pseudobutyrivibrio sp. MD2005]|uniref:family 78 glycoside hydrolase catalytic domain n=1 Tax=Pseudobutyrivibrio sp. MD2005 TaxID=1410616 RepID=UPI0006880971|nr:family 78 glycoside hydrolase catalytic domain [Pseudobutyrivibrio sp. MD2005]
MKLGKWITNNSNSPFVARKTINPSGKVKAAMASVTGLGQFNFYIDGKRISDSVLAPGWTDYRKTVQFEEYDVTSQLQEGKHELSIEVGNGWYIWDMDYGYSFHFPEFMPPNPNPYKPFGKCLLCTMKLEVEYEDGSVECIITDDSWQIKPHRIKHSNVYGSEYIGDDDGVWEQAKLVSDEDIPKGRLTPIEQPPIKVIKTYDVSLSYEKDGIRVYDIGQNISGMLRAKVKGKAGKEIIFKSAEKLDENGIPDQMAKNWMMIDNVIAYKLQKDNEIEDVRQAFTYFAGRYFAVEGDAEVLEFKADAISSAWQQAGYFECDDERYNRIYDMIEKTVEANVLSVHTDCPTIERFAWQEPNHLMGAAIMYMKDGSRLWRKFLHDMRDCQHQATDVFKDFDGNDIYPGDGLVPSQAPCYIPNVLPVPGMGSFYDIIAWGSSIILGARWHYLFYGDENIIKENYDAGMRYLKHLKTKVNDEGFINHGLGDWGNPKGDFARENIETAFLYADTITLAWFAEELGYQDDKANLIKYAETIKENYNSKLLIKDENGRFCYRNYEKRKEGIVTTQATQALPLYWNMVPEYAVEDVATCLRKNIEESGALIAGEVGLPYVIQAAAKHGMNQLLADCITKEEHPSYYAFILDGETTLGEYWETNPRSHCHDMMGHIAEWFYNGIGGIEIKEPGFKKISLHPFMPEGMNELQVSYRTPFGEIKVQGTRINGKPQYTYTIPKEITVQP